jgi:hypothetical protein
LTALAKLEEKLKEKQVVLDPWFDRPNKLRFLQANKFKTSNTVDSMIETTKWRAKEFPVVIDEVTLKMLVFKFRIRTQVRFTFAGGTINIDRLSLQI